MNNNKKNLTLLTILAVLFSFTSCKKIEETSNNESPLQKTMPQMPMRSFGAFDDFTAEVAKTLEFSYDELVAYEKSINFNSFGKLAEQKMMPVLNAIESNTMVAGNVSQVLSNNSDFLQIVSEDGEDYCETKYYLSPYRYIMNQNCMFKVDTFYFKVFEGGHVYCGVSHYNDLRDMSETDFSTLESNDIFSVFKYSTGEKGNYGTYKEVYAEKGTERVYVRFTYGEGMRRMVAGCVRIDMGFLTVKTHGKHKWAGIWWASHRTHSQDISVYLNVHDTLVFGNVKGTKLGYGIEQYTCVFSKTFPYEVYNPKIYIHSAWGYGKVPAVTCNINWQ
jgi:hypothetical protein